ncbi:hypothetical protein [Thalassospira marina]|uniref:hypothetical protein n=1 Tax=Thalassospira marina TaxID=2048283 RepID=UPI001054E898|nr:hypothetical protein [Thalassospira marina]
MHEHPHKGVPLSYLAAQRREFIYFHCAVCKRCIAKTPEELISIASPTTGLETLCAHLKCVDCGAKRFFFRVGYPQYELERAKQR